MFQADNALADEVAAAYVRPTALTVPARSSIISTYEQVGLDSRLNTLQVRTPGTLTSVLLDDSYKPKSLLLNRLHRHDKSQAAPASCRALGDPKVHVSHVCVLAGLLGQHKHADKCRVWLQA